MILRLKGYRKIIKYYYNKYQTENLVITEFNSINE